MQFNEKYRMLSWEIRKRFNGLFRWTRFVLLEKNLEQDEKDCPSDLQNGAVVVRSGNAQADLDDIVQNFPDDLGFPLFGSPKSVLRTEVAGRFSIGIPIFVARDAASGELLGAVWCPDCDFLNDLPDRFASKKSYKIANLFTVPSARGRGIAQKLLFFAEKTLKSQGYQYVFSLVRPQLHASLRCHLKVGFQPLGELTMKTFFHRSFKVVREDQNSVPSAVLPSK